jgi:hypothetical protein
MMGWTRRVTNAAQEDPMPDDVPSPFELSRMYFHYCREAHRKSMTTRYSIVTDLLRAAWCRETASPSCQEAWSEANPAFGQCAVSALVVQDLMGGELLRAEVPGFGSHYWNQLPNGEDVYLLDTTRTQFPYGTTVPRGDQVPRSRLLEGERAAAARTPERYALLVTRVAAVMRRP